ncbi:c-type cytochrome domain-containing protein [Verrucomicrobium spinosum]|uniref:c-type cytochrome domain-containing protein n=1 Tax=Verrucomicrobium spinosum TaxID=2736 RepID=UPI001C47B540
MNRLRLPCLWFFLAGTALPAFASDHASRAALTFFEKEVRPILANRCYDCHGEKKQKGGLRADHIEFLKVGGDSGPALVPGNPGASPLMERCTTPMWHSRCRPRKSCRMRKSRCCRSGLKWGHPGPKTPRRRSS